MVPHARWNAWRWQLNKRVVQNPAWLLVLVFCSLVGCEPATDVQQVTLWHQMVVNERRRTFSINCTKVGNGMMATFDDITLLEEAREADISELLNEKLW